MVEWCLLFLSKSGKLDLKIMQAFWCSIANNKLLNIQLSFSFILKSISETTILTSSNIFSFLLIPSFFSSILLLIYKNVHYYKNHKHNVWALSRKVIIWILDYAPESRIHGRRTLWLLRNKNSWDRHNVMLPSHEPKWIGVLNE